MQEILSRVPRFPRASAYAWFPSSFHFGEPVREERGYGKAQPQHVQIHGALKSFPRLTAIPALRLVLRTQSRSVRSSVRSEIFVATRATQFPSPVPPSSDFGAAGGAAYSAPDGA